MRLGQLPKPRSRTSPSYDTMTLPGVTWPWK